MIKRVMQRFMCALLMSCTLVMAVSSPYYNACCIVKAGAVAPVLGSAAWELWVYLLMSLGITVEVTDSSLTEELAKELQDSFDLWVDSNGFKEDAEKASKIKDNLGEIVTTGVGILAQGSLGVLNINPELWGALKGWVREEIFTKSIAPSLAYNQGFASAVAQIKADYPNIYFPQYCYVSGRYPVSDTGYQFIFSSYPLTVHYSEYFHDAMIAKDTNNFMGYVSSNGVAQIYVSYAYNYPARRYIVYNGHSSVAEYSPYVISTAFSGRVLWANYDIEITAAPDLVLPDADKDDAYDLVGIPGIGDAIENGSYDVITQGRTWDGTDVAGDVILTLPDEQTRDKIWGGDIPGIAVPGADVLDNIGVTPIDKELERPLEGENETDRTIDETIDNANNIARKTKIKGIGAKAATLFPFCIPFDMRDAFAAMVTTQQAPVFETDVYIRPVDYTWHIKIDMADYEDQIAIFRWGVLLLFIVGLMFGSHKLIKWRGGGD